MSFNINDWFPHFTFFVLILTPILVVLTYALIAFSRFFKVRPGPVQTKGMQVGVYLGYIPIIFMFFPIWEIGEYIMGYRTEVVGRLFSWHLPILMYVIVLTGIGQVLSLLWKTEVSD